MSNRTIERIEFDQFQRYETISRIISSFRTKEEETFRILEVGANSHRRLKLFLPNDTITFSDVNVPESERNEHLVAVDGTDMPFEDQSFDFVVAADVLEHVPAVKRALFLGEAHRVCKKCAILSFPCGAEDTVDAENAVNSYYKSLFGEDFLWLEEHRTNGLPNQEEINRFLQSKKIEYTAFNHGNVDIWEKMWKGILNSIHKGDMETMELLHQYYNTKLYAKDVHFPCYRTFYVLYRERVQETRQFIKNMWISEEPDTVFLDLFSAQLARENLNNLKVQNIASLFWADETQDFSEERKIESLVDNESGHFYLKTEFPQQITKLRFDPCEEKGCIVLNLRIFSDVGELQACPQNGRCYGETWVFLNGDPQFLIDIGNKNPHEIEINGNVIQINSLKMISFLRSEIEDFDRIKEEIDACQISLEDKERHIQNLNGLIETQKQQYQAEYHELEAAHEVTQSELQHRCEEIKEIQKKLEDANQRYDTVCADYQKKLEQEEKQCKAAIEQLNEKKEKLDQDLAHYKEHYFAAISQREDLKRQLAAVQQMYDVMSTSTCWKMTQPLRTVLDAFKAFIKNHKSTYMVYKGMKCWKENGTKYTWVKVKNKLKHRQQYQEVAQKALFTPEELEKQRKTTFKRHVKFSVVVPLYNTPPKFLHEMIQSVLDQTYANWELCLADGSDQEHQDVKKICLSYARKDSRIKYQKLEKNLGISGNTNACLDMATGEYIALFDHDDLLHPAALFEVMRAICEQNADMIYTDENTFHEKPEDAFCPHFKPDFSPDTLRSYNYICHFTAFSKKLLKRAGGGFRSEYDGSQDYDMILRLTEQAQKIVHIPEILYYWRSHANSVASDISAKPYTIAAAKKALAAHLERVGLKGTVHDSKLPSTYRIAYDIKGTPLISILIPNKDHIDDLQKCIESIKEKSTYSKWEIIVIENNSTENETFAYYREIQKDQRIRVVYWKKEFNYSAINNFGAQYAKGQYLLLLNNDIEVITPDWMEQMLMFAQRKDVGAVGSMLYYPDETIQHAGVVLGIGGVAGHSHKYFPRGDNGYMSRLTIAQNYSAVTAACMMIPRKVWDEVHGLDEGFKVAFNDVDLCMRIRKAGYLIVWTPYAEMYHYESKSRGLEDTPEKQQRFAGEIQRFQDRWGETLKLGDPCYNPNFTLTREDFSMAETRNKN